MRNEVQFRRNELLLGSAKARIADKQLRALGLAENEAGKLAVRLEKALRALPAPPRARLPVGYDTIKLKRSNGHAR